MQKIETLKRQTPTLTKSVKVVVKNDEIGETTIAPVVAANVKPTAANLVTRPLGRNEILMVTVKALTIGPQGIRTAGSPRARGAQRIRVRIRSHQAVGPKGSRVQQPLAKFLTANVNRDAIGIRLQIVPKLRVRTQSQRNNRLSRQPSAILRPITLIPRVERKLTKFHLKDHNRCRSLRSKRQRWTS